MANTNTSIVDYLSSVGQASDFNSRSTLAGKYGITGYAGTADQNTRLLGLVKGGSTPTATPISAALPATSTPAVTTPTATPTTSVSDARQKLVDYYAGLPSTSDLYTKYSNDQGLPQQQELVNGLTKTTMATQDLIDNIEPSVNSRVGDFFVNEGDRASIVGREQKPLLTEYNKLLRNKQYEEIGLAGKQQMVRDLLSYSLQDQQNKAKQYQLGVDFTTEDQKIATDLLNTKNDQAFQLTKMEKQFANDLALQNAKEKTSTNTDTSKKTEAAWNDIIKGSNTEYDVWQRINDNQQALKAMGVDVNSLWAKHKALADSVGTGGKIKGSTTIDYTTNKDNGGYY